MYPYDKILINVGFENCILSARIDLILSDQNSKLENSHYNKIPDFIQNKKCIGNFEPCVGNSRCHNLDFLCYHSRYKESYDSTIFTTD